MKSKEQPIFWELGYMTIVLRGEPKKVCIRDYIDAKTADLKEFGYSTLNEQQLQDSLWRVLNDEAIGENVIDQFVKGDKPCFIK